ncbi:MAG TPA: Hsp20 family protein [Methylomirabilota bacterium]|jgi:HSP20 family protein|nr:Hsp20 family protein [Methylomirabilota bacterium]
MMRGLMPWTGIESLQREMDRLLDRIARVKRTELPALGDWVPSLDVAETGDSLVAIFEVPGLERQDVEIGLHDGLLTIKGEKRRDPEARYHRAERACGVFVRSLRLPVAVDAARVTATVKNGLLTVTLPKTPAARGTMIPILED